MSNRPRTLREYINNLSVWQRLLFATAVPLFIGFVALLLVSYNQLYQAEKRLVIGGQEQLLNTTISQMEVFFQSLPETTIALSNSTSLENLFSTEAQLRDTNTTLTARQRSEISQSHAEALSDLTSEISQIITRAPIYNTVRIFDINGEELLRVEQSATSNVPRIALPNELGDLSRKEYFQSISTLNQPFQVNFSGIELNEAWQPVLHITTPIVFRGEKVGGVTVDVLAQSFFEFVSGEEKQTALSDHEHLILLDSHGMYLADTRTAAPEFGQEYSGYLLGFDPEGGVTLIEREPELASITGTSFVGHEIGSNLVSNRTFNPFSEEVSGTPWHLVALQDTHDAFADLNRFSLILLGTIIATMMATLLILWRVGKIVIRPLTEAAAIAVRVSAGDISARIPVRRDDEIGRLAQAINSMTEHLQDNITDLQDQFSERTRDLEVAGDIANIAVGIGDVQSLLSRTVNLVRDRFSFYHVQVFLVNESGDTADLVASTGEAGKIMLSEHWTLGVGSDSVIGQVTANGSTVIALDTDDAVVVHRPNPHLPETRSEMALPMKYGEGIIGALDIQSIQPNAFSPEDVRIFEVLANQLAIAINNARQLEETRRQVDRVEELNRRLTRQAWDDFIAGQQEDLSEYLTTSVTLVDDPVASTEGAITAPIAVRGEVIGTLTTAPGAGGTFDPDEVALITAVAERISLAVENARLVTETQVSLTETERLYLSAQIINSGGSEIDILQGLHGQFSMPTRIFMAVLYSAERNSAGEPMYMRRMLIDPRLPEGLRDATRPYTPEDPGLYSTEKEPYTLQGSDAIREKYIPQQAEAMLEWNITSLAYFPFLMGDELLGYLVVAHFDRPYTFTEREMEIFEALTGQMATVLRSRQLFSTVETERTRLQSVLETMPTAVVVLDAATGQPLISNELAVNLLGAETDLHQLSAQNRLLRADSTENYPLEEIPAMQALTQGTLAFSEDLSIQQTNGSTVSVMNNAAPILDAEGNVTAVVTVFQDITELRDLQSALQDTLRETTTMYESSQAIFAESDQDAIAQQMLTYLLANTEPDQVHLLMTAASEQSFAMTVNPIAVIPTDLPLTNPYPPHLLDDTRMIIIPNVAADTQFGEHTHKRLLENNIHALITMPLQAAGDTIGWLALSFYQPQQLSADQVRFLTALTDQTAVALQNTRLREQTEAALNETLLLYDASRDINRAGSMQHILEIFVSFALGPEATAAAVLLLEGPYDARTLMPAATWSADQQTTPEDWLQLAEELQLILPEWVVEEDQPYLIENYPEEIAANTDLQVDSRRAAVQPSTVIVLPMIAAERVVGLVQINYADPYIHTERRLRMYRSLVDQVASAVENRRLLEQTRASLSETERLYHASQVIRDAGSVEEVVGVLQSLSMTYAPSNLDIYALVDDRPHHIHHWDVENGVTDQQEIDQLEYSISDGHELINRPVLFRENLDQISDDPVALDFLERTGAKSLVAIPLNLRNRPMGRLIMTFSEERTFPKTERDYLIAVCDQAAIVIDNWTLLQRTQESLDETQMLYETSSAIADVNDGPGILAALVEHALPDDITTAQLILLHGDDWHEPGVNMEITATWSRDDSIPDLSGMVFSADQYPGWDTLATPELLIIDNIAESDLPEEEKNGYELLGLKSLTLVPLSGAGRSLGVLFFGATKPRHHAEREHRVYQSLAELATISLENINLLQQTQTRARQLQTSAEVSRTVTSLLDVSELLPRMVNLIQERFNYDHVQVFLLDEARENAVLQASTGEIGQSMLAMDWSLEVGSASVIGQVIERAEPVIALDTLDAAVPHRTNPFLPDTRSEMAIPLISRGTVVGALDVQSNRAGAFSDEDVAVLSSLADQIAVALDNARLFADAQGYTQALASQVQSLQSLLDASQSFTTTLDAQEILESAARYMVELLAVDHCGIAIKNPDSDTMGTVLAEYPIRPSAGRPINLAEAWWRAEFDITGMPVVVDDVATSTKMDEHNRELLLAIGVHQIVLVPLMASGEKITGSIGLDIYEGGRKFSSEELTLLQLFATQVATAYQNAQLFEGQQIAAHALELQVSRMETLYATSLAMSESMEEDAILGTALTGIVNTLQIDGGAAFVTAGRDGAMARLVAAAGDMKLDSGRWPFAANHYYATWQVSPLPIIIDDIATTEEFIPELRAAMVEGGHCSAVMAPLLVGGQLFGGFSLLMKTKRVFEPAEITLIQTLTTQVGLALQNARLFGQAQEQAENMSFLFNVTTAAAASTEMQDSMETVVHQISQNIPGDVYAVYLANHERNALEQIAIMSRAANHNLSKRIPLSGMLSEHALAERRPFIIGDIQSEADTHGMITPDLHGLLAAPLFAADKITGLLLIFKDEANFYRTSNLQLLQALSGSLSAVVQNIQLLEDIREANERLRELDKIKSQFLANMSHELRTPLNSIIGFSRVILKGIDGPLTDMQEQDLETIHSSGQHLLNLINDILDSSKIEAEKLTLALDWFAVDAVVDVARSMSVGLLKDKTVRLNVEAEGNLPQVWGDEIRTRQVLLNLLSNAAKFTNEGSITISVFTVQQDDGPYIQISVADSGIGIPDDKLDTVFAAFEQVDGSLTRTSGGTGLGLPISKSLIEMMGGSLWVESTVGVGSIFSFTIPAYAKEMKSDDGSSEVSGLESEEQLPYEQQELAGRKTIMVIDDEVGMHQMYRRYLNKAGYVVEATANPIQAEDLVRVIHPDIILLDVRMPQRDGWDVLEKFKANDETAHIPIIICSIDPNEERGLSMGAVEYLTKPFLEDDLLKAVQEAEAHHIKNRVLIVDDKPESVRLIVELLNEQDHFYIQTATSAQKALDLIQQKQPDLLMLDLNMPEVSGIELLETLRNNPRTRNLPVLVITAEDALADQEQQRLRNIEVYSKSDLDESQFLTGVQNILGHNNHNNN